MDLLQVFSIYDRIVVVDIVLILMKKTRSVSFDFVRRPLVVQSSGCIVHFKQRKLPLSYSTISFNLFLTRAGTGTDSVALKNCEGHAHWFLINLLETKFSSVSLPFRHGTTVFFTKLNLSCTANCQIGSAFLLPEVGNIRISKLE